jgi:hypothetical protein
LSPSASVAFIVNVTEVPLTTDEKVPVGALFEAAPVLVVLLEVVVPVDDFEVDDPVADVVLLAEDELEVDVPSPPLSPEQPAKSRATRVRVARTADRRMPIGCPPPL